MKKILLLTGLLLLVLSAILLAQGAEEELEEPLESVSVEIRHCQS